MQLDTQELFKKEMYQMNEKKHPVEVWTDLVMPLFVYDVYDFLEVGCFLLAVGHGGVSNYGGCESGSSLSTLQ